MKQTRSERCRLKRTILPKSHMEIPNKQHKRIKYTPIIAPKIGPSIGMNDAIMGSIPIYKMVPI